MMRFGALALALLLAGCASAPLADVYGVGENTYFDRPHPSHIEGEAWRDGKVVRP